MQWYTPLMAWWLPQRTLLFGFAAAISVLMLVLSGASSGGQELGGVRPRRRARRPPADRPRADADRARDPAVRAASGDGDGASGSRSRRRGAHRRRPPGAARAHRPRLDRGPYGTNVYPWIEPGWLANAGTTADPSGRLDLSVGNLVGGAVQAIGMVGTPQWWGFWLANLGIAVPLLAFTVLAMLARRAGGESARAGRALTAAFPVPLLELALGALIIFAACNLVVFQTWNWDNTKLLVYWYLVIALLIGALATHWWRRVWPRIAAIVLVAPVLLTGTLVVLRLLPWTPPADSMTGPYTIANTQEVQLASTLDKTTPKGAVFLTFGRPNDPVLAVAGRIGVMGYGGWLWSYGIDIGTRYADVQTMYTGCAERRGDVPDPRAPAQVRDQLCGDRRSPERPRRGRLDSRSPRGGRTRDSRSWRAPITSSSTTCVEEPDVAGGVALARAKPSISAVLPAYNEEAVIAETVQRTGDALAALGIDGLRDARHR